MLAGEAGWPTKFSRSMAEISRLMISLAGSNVFAEGLAVPLH